MNKKITPVDIPDSADAEQWLSPSIFIWHGKTWEITPRLQVVEFKEPEA